MKYQIKNLFGDIVDKDLSYEEALIWVENSITGRLYSMEPMKESDQNDCHPL